MKKSLLILVLTTLCLFSCAPGLESTINIDRFPEPQRSARAELPSKVVQIVKVNDARPNPWVAEIKGREVSSSRDVAVVVREGFESYLNSEGVRVVMFDSQSHMTIDVKELSIIVQPGFPTSSAEAKARIEVELITPAGRYLGKYESTTSAEHPMLDQDRIETALGESLGEAIHQAVSDQKLINMIS